MVTVALVGPDGAGKTTLCSMLAASGLFPCRRIYMGVEFSSSNLTLPTSWLAARLKRRLDRPGDARSAGGRRRRARRGPVRALARLCNRLAEAWYRQLAARYYQLRGFVVLYDRHFALDFAREIAEGAPEPLDRRLHRWCMTYLYPQPDLVIFLDVPGEILFARKGEWTVEELERRRQGFLLQGRRLRNFVRVDASRPLPVVYAEVADRIVTFQRQRGVRLQATTG